MGIYLSTPSSDVAVESLENKRMKIAVGEMQGWRKNMEDAHIALDKLDTHSVTVGGDSTAAAASGGDISLFGVFDGHGGKEVAKFTKIKYAEELVKLAAFKNGDYGTALRQSFHRIDELLEDRQYDPMLRELRALPNPSDIRNRAAATAATPTSPMWGKSPAGASYGDDDDSSDEDKDSDSNDNDGSGGGGGGGDNDEEEDDEDDDRLESNKKLSTSEALELIKSLLDKRTSEKKDVTAEGAVAEPVLLLSDKAANDNSIEVFSTSGAAAAAAVAAAVSEEEDGPGSMGSGFDLSKSSVGTATSADPIVSLANKKPDMSIIVPSDSDIRLASDIGEGVSPKVSAVTAGEIIPTYNTTERGAKMCKLHDHRLNAGCTAVVTLKVGNKLITANAGDSRGVLCRRDGKAHQLSYDHKPMHPTELNRIVQAGGFVNEVGRINGNLNLSRSLGDLKYKQGKHLERHQHMITAEPDITVTEIEEGDRFFMLACDGVWDVMTCQQACDFVRLRLDEGKEPAQIVEEVCHFCLSSDPRKTEGIGGDNMTCLIVQLLGDKQ